MVRILVLSFYYAPDLSAGSFRTSALVKTILKKNPGDVYIDVITTLPNRYKTFSEAALEYVKSDELEIHRIKLPPHKSGMRDQSKAFIKYFKNASSLAAKRDYDLVYATSSRLMTAVLGAWIASRKKTKLYLDIRDIFVDTINNILPRKFTFILKPFFSFIERWTVSKADKVNLVSEGFREYFKSRYPGQQLSFFTNGIDNEFLNIEDEQSKVVNIDSPIKVLYAGNMGEGQGLHIIIPKLAQKMHDRVQFLLIGDGGRKSELQFALAKAGCKNVELRQPVNREGLINAYLDADVLFLHLNDYDAFRKVLPSKIFEYAALAKPIWAGVSGYAAEFIYNEIDNAVVFPPCDPDEAVNVFENLKIIDKQRPAFIEKFSRKNIMNLMADDVLSII